MRIHQRWEQRLVQILRRRAERGIPAVKADHRGRPSAKAITAAKGQIDHTASVE